MVRLGSRHRSSFFTRVSVGAKVLYTLLLAISFAGRAVAAPSQDEVAALRASARQNEATGNYQDAYKSFRSMLLDLGVSDSDTNAERDLSSAINCLNRLSKVVEIDEFLESAIKKNSTNPYVLISAGEAYLRINHFGSLVSGEFRRGQVNQGGYIGANQRDRIRALQLFLQALKITEGSDQKGWQAKIYTSIAGALMESGKPWLLGAKSDVAKLPDYEEGYQYNYRQNLGAPVDDKGNPIFYSVPTDFDSAKNDGERWRWALEMAAKAEPTQSSSNRATFARFLKQQFDVATLAHVTWNYDQDSQDDLKINTFNLSTLSKNETIARLAGGVRRFSLPDEFNFITIFEEIGRGSDSIAEGAMEELISTFENRRQYVKAAELLQDTIRRFGSGSQNERQKRLDQIVGAWGTFEAASSFPAGQPAELSFKFRNATNVAFVARAVDVDALMKDVMEYLQSNPRNFSWNEIDIQNVGRRFIEGGGKKYLRETIEKWSQPLTSRPDHSDSRTVIKTPLSKEGAYLVTSTLAGGNTTQILVWINKFAIVRKDLKDGVMYFVADARTGVPAPKVELELFGYKQEATGRNSFLSRPYDILTKKFSTRTNEEGIAVIPQKDFQPEYQWLVVVRDGVGNSYDGFQGVWFGSYATEEYNQLKFYGITDRPVYRPKQKVNYKVWVRRAAYGDVETSPYAGKPVTIQISNPSGEVVETKSGRFDKWGGIEGDWTPSETATLGSYGIIIKDIGHAVNFRLEEYKKPEFEVQVTTSDKPVMLGDKVPVTISAKYYFGGPVAKGKLKYKVQRTPHTNVWFVPSPWDWLYGPGYWWFAPNYEWYPRWFDWGCESPRPWWLHNNSYVPPEVVSEAEVELSLDGTFTFEIDTTLAKELFSNSDHKYQVTAEVVDESRRTIVGSGSALVARKPFSVYAWLDRGYYRQGDTIRASFNARTLDNKPVTGSGTVTLFKISYDNKRQPEETLVRSWKLPTGPEGNAELQMTAGATGQYRLAYELIDEAKHKIEGAYVFSVVSGESAGDFRFNALEVIAEKKEYSVGETVRLLINTEQADSTVLLFVRPPTPGRYAPPHVLKLKGRSTVFEFAIHRNDMPNIFVEALTVNGGRLYTQSREIVVPPEHRVLNVEVIPSAREYKPGAEASVELKVSDPKGAPVPSTAVITVYDRSVDYISGGTSISEIREFFWKWRRSHSEISYTNLSRAFYALADGLAMRPLGVFGGTATEQGQLVSARGFSGGAVFADRRVARMEKSLSLDSAEPAAPMMQAAGAMMEADASLNEAGGGTSSEIAPVVRKEFADTAYWNGLVSIDEKGIAKVNFRMPENLTGWKIRSWVLGEGSRVGEASVEVVTTKKLLVRVQTPRFLVETDEVVLSANVHNYLNKSKRVRVTLDVSDQLVKLLSPKEQIVEVDSQGTVRVDWRAQTLGEGQAVVRMSAFTDEESDAMEVQLPIKVRGILKTESFSASIRPDRQEAKIEFTVPEARRIEQSRLEVRFSPSLALSMVDALPYLVSYPYGCTEQSLNRFLPTVIVQGELKRLGVSLDEIRRKRSNLNAQEIGADRKRADKWKVYPENPVFDEETVRTMARAGLERLTSMQMSDGGWGWFSGYGEVSTAHTTVTVVRGLQAARKAGLQVPAQVIDRGVRWLANYEAGQLRELKNAVTQTIPSKQRADALDALVHLVLVDEKLGANEMREFLYRDRNDMPLYAKVLQGLIYDTVGDAEKRSMLLKNIEQFLFQDDENQTAYLKLGETNYWWYWYGSEIEANAYYLKLLARIDPAGANASRLVKYLINNRRNGVYWNSTRDTALVLEAMGDFLAKSGQTAPEMGIEVYLDGKKLKEVSITRETLFSFDNSVVLTGADVTSGKHVLELRRRGRGEVYMNAYVTNFTQEANIAKAGLEIKVNRALYRLIPNKDATTLLEGAQGQAVTAKVEKYKREKLASMSEVKSGDLVEVELEVESKNDYEYVLLEDFKPAGVEPVTLQSGYDSNALNAYVEYRDDRVSYFARFLPRGKRSVSYRVRAETPGNFSALPTIGLGMYSPELRANSDDFRIIISE